MSRRRTRARRQAPRDGQPDSAAPASPLAGTGPATVPRWPVPWPLLAGLLLALLVLLAQVRTYWFFTDDGFISFRYARNLSHGFGLVFNPGGERVEGYSNFLWVLLLAGLDALGWKPESAANVLGVTATVALWSLVVGFAWRRARTRADLWLLLVPSFALALTRSFAVWATSGLETRLYELLIVTGCLRLVTEVEAEIAGEPVRRTLAPLWFGLAALTRPDGVLVAGCAALAAALHLGIRLRRWPWRPLARWWPCAALIAGQLAFRLAYYGEWLPNTYYAKIGGRLAWRHGGAYLTAFALEYAAFLWLPLIVLAVLRRRREGSSFATILFGLVIVPHALYVAAIGGDHFEYRPLDLYFPLIALLLYEGARQWSWRPPARALVGAVYLAIVAVGLVELPLRSHLEFPGTYMVGFPGEPRDSLGSSARFLDPDRDPIYRLPGLRSIASWHQRLVRGLTTRLVAIRQEEHRLFLGTVRLEADRIRTWMASGRLPRDLYLAIDCVGFIPYATGVRTLDRLGLTDARVAHSPFVRDILAHGKYATLDYARERGVDLWPVDPVHIVCPLTSNTLIGALYGIGGPGPAVYTAGFTGEGYPLCNLPGGYERSLRRMPRFGLRPLADTAMVAEIVRRTIAAWEDTVRLRPDHVTARRRLAFMYLMGGRFAEARREYLDLLPLWPADPMMWEKLSEAEEALGDPASAARSLERGRDLALGAGDTAFAGRMDGHLAFLRESLAAPGNGGGARGAKRGTGGHTP